MLVFVLTLILKKSNTSHDLGVYTASDCVDLTLAVLLQGPVSQKQNNPILICPLFGGEISVLFAFFSII